MRSAQDVVSHPSDFDGISEHENMVHDLQIAVNPEI